MIHGMEQDRKLTEEEIHRIVTGILVIAIFIASILFLLISCTTSNIVYKKEKLNNNYTVYYYGDYKFFSDSTLYESGDTVKDLHEICYPIR